MTPGVAWIVAGLVACGAEMLVPGVFLLPIGIAALGTGAVAEALGLGTPGQVLVFVGLTAATIGAAATRMHRRGVRVDTVNAPSAGLIGQTCRAIAFEGNEGRVSLGDGTWSARGGGDAAPGTLLQVVGLDGTTLLVAVPSVSRRG